MQSFNYVPPCIIVGGQLELFSLFCTKENEGLGECASSGSKVCRHQGDGRMWVGIRQALTPAQCKTLAGLNSRCVLYSPRSGRRVCACARRRWDVCVWCFVSWSVRISLFVLFVYVLLRVSIYVCVSV